MRSDLEWSRQRDESLIDILTEFCPSLVFYKKKKNFFVPLFSKNEKKM